MFSSRTICDIMTCKNYSYYSVKFSCCNSIVNYWSYVVNIRTLLYVDGDTNNYVRITFKKLIAIIYKQLSARFKKQTGDVDSKQTTQSIDHLHGLLFIHIIASNNEFRTHVELTHRATVLYTGVGKEMHNAASIRAEAVFRVQETIVCLYEYFVMSSDYRALMTQTLHFTTCSQLSGYCSHKVGDNFIQTYSIAFLTRFSVQLPVFASESWEIIFIDF